MIEEDPFMFGTQWRKSHLDMIGDFQAFEDAAWNLLNAIGGSATVEGVESELKIWGFPVKVVAEFSDDEPWTTFGGLDWPILGHSVAEDDRLVSDYFASLTQQWAEDLDAEMLSTDLPGVKSLGGREIWVSVDGLGCPPPASVFEDDDLVCSIGLN